MWSKKNVVWYSDTPKIELDGNTKTGTIAVGNKVIPIALAWGPGANGSDFDICKFVQPNDGVYKYEVYISGRWEPRGDDIVLIIEVDKLFDNKYPEILLKQRAVDNETSNQ